MSTTSAGYAGPIVSNLCFAFNILNSIIYILALLFMILGGALYAGSHVAPAQSRGVLQGYGMGLVLGGLIGAVVAIISPWMLSILTGNSMVLISACA